MNQIIPTYLSSDHMSEHIETLVEEMENILKT